MKVDFTKIPNSDPEADDFIGNHILAGAHSSQAQLLAWYRYMEESLPFPFEAYMPANKIAGTLVHVSVIIKQMAEISKCGPKQLWVYGEVPFGGNYHYYFFLEDMYSLLGKIECYKPIYYWKYWLNKQRKGQAL